MPEEKKKLTKEEKIAKGKKIMTELEALELTEEEMKSISGGWHYPICKARCQAGYYEKQ